MKKTIQKLLREGLNLVEDINDLNHNYFNSSYISKICNKLGYEFKYNLESGNNGVAYVIAGKKVLKITTDKTEFLVANKLKGKKLHRISNVYNTFKIKNQEVYIIVLELLDSLSEEIFEIIEEYNGVNIKYRNDTKFDWLRNELNDIALELKNNGISDPTDYDWWMNMGIKQGKLSVFDVGDKTIDYNDYPELDLTDL